MISALLLVVSSAFAAPSWHDSLPAALAESQSSGKPILMDFQAPWCYSCYYMEKHVLEGAAFGAASSKVVLLKLDVDKEDGRALKEKYKVSFLPSYLLLSAKQEPLGRIVGEQTEEDFFKQFDALLAGAAGDPLEQALASFKKRLAAGSYASAAGDIGRLPKATLKSLQARPDWQILTARLELMKDVRAKKAAGAEALKKTLALDDSCEEAYDVSYAEDLVGALKPEAKSDVLKLERKAMERLSDTRLFVPADRRCADFRTGIENLADIDNQLGMKAQRQELLVKTVSFLELQGSKPGEDRNLDDNRRFFLELLGDEAKLSSLYAELIAAYPSDYVYAYRWAKYLQAHGKSADALPFIETAAKLAYGANRLQVTGVRAKVLADLGRKDEALALLQRDARAGRRSFPKEAASLDEVTASLKK
jgi:thiol-disulfide isomerase/thioredoxin